MPALTATRDADSVSVRVELAFPGLAPWQTEYKFRDGAALLAANVAGFILDKAATIEGLLARAAELDHAVGLDVCPLLSDATPPEPHPLVDVILDRVTRSYEQVTLDLRCVHRATGAVVPRQEAFTHPDQMTRAALQQRLAQVLDTADRLAERLDTLAAVAPALEPMRGVDLVAWARAGAPVPEGEV